MELILLFLLMMVLGFGAVFLAWSLGRTAGRVDTASDDERSSGADKWDARLK